MRTINLVSLTCLFVFVKCFVLNFLQSAERYYMCSSVEKCERILNTAEVMGMIPVIWTSSDFSVDAYFMTSFHNILDIMKNTPTIHVLVQVDYLVNNLIQIIQYAPQRSIFVIAHESSISLNICSFGSYNSNITKPFIFHLHHEMPWLGLGFNSECNATILSTYAKVFRNYYSRPWQGELSQYIPLGSTGARYIRWYNGRYGVKKSSDRLFWCNFIGRRGYTHTSPSPFHQQRNDLLDIIPNHNNEETIKPKSCEAYSDVDESGLSEGGPFTFDTYIWYLSETTFTLCPAGNSPETFRHYEVIYVHVCILIFI